MGLFSKIKAVFNSKKVAVKSIEKAIEIKKVALIVGHGNGDSGAMGWNGVSEFDYNASVASAIEMSLTEKEVKVFFRGSSGIAGVAKQAVKWGADIVIELHLNAFNSKAKGCEVLCLEGDLLSGEKAKSFAKLFCEKFNRVKRRDAGVNWISSSDRGGLSLRSLSSTSYAILVEPFFIDNKEEWIDPKEYASFLKEWIKGL